MPSSKDRSRVEIPTYVYDQLAHVAETEGRTVTSVLQQVVYLGLGHYEPEWIPSRHLLRFNRRARHSLDLAREEALGFNHHYIGTEHLLLGLLREEGGLAAQVLGRLGVTTEGTREAVESIVGRGEEPAEEEIEYVPRARKALALSVAEATRLGHGYVRTEHILLGLVREGGGMATGILDDFGVLGSVRQQTLESIGRQLAAGGIDDEGRVS
ncbi:MAG: hypothetical protein M3P51_08575 [Chloroflexota bacterium]|nr:hypothetical protein [Chloroflexota bacterium]